MNNSPNQGSDGPAMAGVADGGQAAKARIPLQETLLRMACDVVCFEVLGNEKSYNHASTPTWNAKIIEGILSKLLENTDPSKRTSGSSLAPKYKFVVHSSIIQGLESDGQGGERQASRGIHSAVGAYWNNDCDGVWSTKWDGHPTKALQVVVSIVYIALI